VHQRRGRFPPKSRQRASPECPPPSWDQPRPQSSHPGGGQKNCSTNTNHRAPGRRENFWVATKRINLDRSQKWFARSTRCDARTIQGPLASGFPRSSGPRGKAYSAHQAVTKYLTNNSPCCSDSSNCSNLLSFGALSHAIIPVGQLAPMVSALGYVPVYPSPFQESS
jgi:hypothetical protein